MKLPPLFTAAHALLALILALAAGQAAAQTQLQNCAEGSGAEVPGCQPADPPAGITERLPVAKSRAPAPASAIPTKDRAGFAEPPEPPRQPAAPRPPSEFQQFVAAAVGQLLPIYGGDLFDTVPATFAPVERVPVSAGYVLGPGDELLIRVWGQVSLNLDLTIDRAGVVFIPQAGSISLAGLPFERVQAFLHAQLDRVFRGFELSVTLGQLRSIQVFVAGEARRPGAYTVSGLSTLVNALFVSGGPTAEGSLRRVQLKRDGQAVAEFDLYSLLTDGDKSGDARLAPGDVIYIPVAGAQVAVSGSVKRPGIFELKGGETVSGVLRMAGGLTPVADRTRARLERAGNDHRDAVDLMLDEAGLALRAADGDIFRFLPAALRFANDITLRGNVAHPGRLAWHAGMRLRDALPNREALGNRYYWEQHNRLDLPPKTGKTGAAPVTDLAGVAPEINWSYAVIERLDARDLSRKLMPFNLGGLVLEGDDSQNLELQPGDVVTVFSQADIRMPSERQTRFVRVEGEFLAPGVYEVAPGETLGQLIQRAGGLTPQAYLYGAEFTRVSTRQEQQERQDRFLRDLERDAYQSALKSSGANTAEEDAAASNLRLAGFERLIERLRAAKPTGRIALDFEPAGGAAAAMLGMAIEDGDRFVVPARPATVSVLGAVYNSGSLLHVAETRVADYLKLAGGMTRVADRARVFVIRADGTVLAKQSFGRIGRSFEMTRLRPGDSIVVPEAMPRTPFLRGLRDWTQVFSQLALGGAAVNVLR